MSRDDNNPPRVTGPQAREEPAQKKIFFNLQQAEERARRQTESEIEPAPPLTPEEAAENAQVVAHLIADVRDSLNEQNAPHIEPGQYNAANYLGDKPEYSDLNNNPDLITELDDLRMMGLNKGFTQEEMDDILQSVCEFPTSERTTLLINLKEGLAGQEPGDFIYGFRQLRTAQKAVDAGLGQWGDGIDEDPNQEFDENNSGLPAEVRDNPAAQEFIHEMRHTKKPGHLHKSHLCPLPLLLLMAATTSATTYAAHQVKDLGKSILVELQNSYGAKKGDWEVIISFYDNVNRFLFLFLDGGNKAMQTWLENTATHCRKETGHVSEADWKTINNWKREGDKYFDETLKGTGTKAKRGDVPRMVEHEDIEKIDSIAFDESNESGLTLGR